MSHFQSDQSAVEDSLDGFTVRLATDTIPHPQQHTAGIQQPRQPSVPIQLAHHSIMPQHPAQVTPLVRLAKAQPLRLNKSVVQDRLRALGQAPAQLRFLRPGQLSRPGRRIRLLKRDDLHPGMKVLRDVELHQKAFVKRLLRAIDDFVHDQCTLAIDDVSTLIFLAPAQHMRVLDDHHVRSHLDHKPAGVLNPRRRNVELVRTMEQNDQIIISLSVLAGVSNEIDDIERVCACRCPGGNRKLVFGHSQNSDPHGSDLPDQDPAGGRKVFTGANRGHAGTLAYGQRVREAQRTVIENVIVCQAQNIDARGRDPVQALDRLTERRPCLPYWRRLFDQRAFEVRHDQVRPLELR